MVCIIYTRCDVFSIGLGPAKWILELFLCVSVLVDSYWCSLTFGLLISLIWFVLP